MEYVFLDGTSDLLSSKRRADRGYLYHRNQSSRVGGYVTPSARTRLFVIFLFFFAL